MNYNVVNAVFGGSKETVTRKIRQWDYGMLLVFSGLELPQAYEVHFANTEFSGNAITQIGDENGVSIPDEYLTTGEPVYAWLYLHTGADDGETVYSVKIPVVKRAMPTHEEPTPVQQSEIEQAIVALNTAVEQTAEDVIASGENAQAAQDAADVAIDARDQAIDAKEAAEDAQEAAETAEGHAQEYAQTATDKASEASSYVDDARRYSESASSFASDAQASSEASYLSAQSSSRYASDASGYSSSAYESAQSASGSASDASSAKDSAVQAKSDAISAKNDAVQAKNDSVSAKNDAVSAKNDAVSAKNSAEGFASDASGSADLAEGYANDAQTSAEQAQESAEYVEGALNNKADAITSSASGEIVTISDGGKDLPVVDLKVSLLPVQSGSGDPSPTNVRPISGWTGVDVRATGKNILDMSLLTYFTWNESEGAYKIDPVTSFSIRKSAVPFKDNTQYAITATVRATQSATKWGLFVEYTDGTRSDWERTTTSYQTLTIITDANKTISRIGRQRGADSGSVYIKDWIIAESSVAVPYEPFGQAIPFDWTSTAGTVYGCNIDPVSGVLKVDTEKIVVDGSLIDQVATASTGVHYARVSLVFSSTTGIVACDTYPVVTSTPNSGAIGIRYASNRIYIYDDRFADLATAQAILNANNVGFIIRKSTETIYQLSETQIATYLGVNNFWSNGNGTLDLEYRCDTKLYIEQLTKPSEDDMTANANIASGKFFMVGNRLMLSTTAIAQGEQIVVGTNCTEVSLADALNTINA